MTNFFDTLGIGSFATTTATYKLRRAVDDRVIPGTLNVGHTLPTVAQAFIFIALIAVDVVTLTLLIAASVAGAWLGAAEAPTKLVTAGVSPFIISFGMVAGVFVARWTVPMVLKGSDYVWVDLRQKPHLVVWALLAGMIWAVANTLTVFAIRDVGLSVAFPLWNTNSLVGLFWGWLLFRELRDGVHLATTASDDRPRAPLDVS